MAARPPLFPLTFEFEGCTVTAGDPAWATGTCPDASEPCRHVREVAAELLPNLEPAALEAEVARTRQDVVDARHQLADDREGHDAGLVSLEELDASRAALAAAEVAGAVARGNVRLHQQRRRVMGIGTPEEREAWAADTARSLREFGAVA